MSCRVAWEQDASDVLDRLEAEVVERILLRVDWLAANIDDIKPQALTGPLKGYFKLRAGDYRVIYSVNRTEGLIVIHDIGHRRDVYKDK